MRSAWMVLCVLGCATPYQEKGFRGGYSDQQLSANVYSISVEANAFTSRGTVLQYLHRRAGELCPDGYSIVDAASDTSYVAFRLGDTMQVANKPQGGLIVQCHEPAPPITTPAVLEEPVRRPERPVIESSKPISCMVMASDSTIGMCFFDIEECDRTYAKLASQGYQACAAQPAASCFLATAVLPMQASLVCSPTISNCEAMRAQFLSNPDFQDVPASCSIYRMR